MRSARETLEQIAALQAQRLKLYDLQRLERELEGKLPRCAFRLGSYQASAAITAPRRVDQGSIKGDELPMRAELEVDVPGVTQWIPTVDARALAHWLLQAADIVDAFNRAMEGDNVGGA